jgi:hypothetical protein
MNSKQCEQCVTRYKKLGYNANEVPAVMCCAWCGSTEQILHLELKYSTSMFKHSDFCNSICKQKYIKFVGSWKWNGERSGYTDLSHGLPFCFTGKHPDRAADNVQLRCNYCGFESLRSSVVFNIFMPTCYKHKAFCRNAYCIRQYMNYCRGGVGASFSVPYCYTNQKQIF